MKIKFTRKSNKSRKPFFIYDSSFKSDKRIFLENLGLMIASGVGIIEVLESLGEQMKSKKARYILAQILEDIRNGSKITDSLVKYNFVSENYLKIIQIGEVSGNLAENLEIIIAQQKRDSDLRSKLQSASIYPLFVLVLMVGVGTAIAIFVLPRLTSVYSSLNVDLPALTRFFISVGTFIQQRGIIAVPLFLLTIFLSIYLTFYYKKTRKLGQILLYRLPPTKRLIQEVELARFGYLMGSVLDRGISLPEALELIEKSTIFYQFKDFYKYLRIGVLEGFTFKELFNYYKGTKRLVPVYVRQLVSTAEKTGTLPEAFEKIGKTYEFKVDVTSKNLSTLFEPVLLIIFWLGVAFVALAVILPIYSIIGNFSDISADPELAGETSEEIYNIDDEEPNDEVVLPIYVRPLREGLIVKDQINGTDTVQLTLDTQYMVTEIFGEWYKISFDDGTEGWITFDNVQVI